MERATSRPAGALLVIIGVTWDRQRFIPRPGLIGLTNGLALLIASIQIKDFLGLKT
jgi:SulP family sulfate permease